MLRRWKLTGILCMALAIVFASAPVLSEASDRLEHGAESEAVRAMQSRLAELEYFTAEITGYFGDHTQTAVKNFQIANGLEATGVADAQTIARMKSSDAVSKSTYLASLSTAQAEEAMLHHGDEGEEVKSLQNYLIALGYASGEASGRFGDGTRDAVTLFQKANGLPSTGTVDRATAKALVSPSAVTRAEYERMLERQDAQEGQIQQGDTGNSVVTLQNLLVEYGFYAGDKDGIFGEQTLRSLVAFQRANGLTASGVVDAETRAKLTGGNARSKEAAEAISLKLGDGGEMVAALQGYLAEYGYYSLEVDGAFTEAVEAAVRAFQKENALPETGVVDATMRDLLLGGKAAYEPEYVKAMSLYPAEYGDEGLPVKLLQTRLKALGYYAGAINAKFSTATQTAVSLFQKACGFDVTGKADERTRALLASDEAPRLGSTQARLAENQTYKYAMASDTIRTYQSILQAYGYYTDALDGIFGANMLDAVKRFQAANQLEVTGEIDGAMEEILLSGEAVELEQYLARLEAYNALEAENEAMASGQASRSARMEYVCRMALEQLDKPYGYSEYGPDAFDCSGLTYYLYGLLGITLPRSSQGQGYASERQIGQAELQRGDIVCFDTEADDEGDLCDHVGLYLGEGQFIHASSEAGKVVISTLASGYYQKVFSWGYRPLQ